MRLPVHSVLDKSGHRPPLQLGFAIPRNEPGSPGYFLTSASQFVTTVSELVWAASLLSVRTWNRLPSGRGVSAAQFRVPGLIHVAHASGTQVGRDFVMRRVSYRSVPTVRRVLPEGVHVDGQLLILRPGRRVSGKKELRYSWNQIEHNGATPRGFAQKRGSGRS